MANSELIKFIKEARRRGFGDNDIRNALLDHRWPLIEVEKAFSSFVPKEVRKNQIMLFLEKDLIELLEKRAKKNMFTLPEQIEDILRRSVLSQKNKKSVYDEKLDDKLVGLFSRKRTGPKRKKK